ncbi:tyrosine-protein phosphatase [Coprobacter tertius]|uniref:Tyrosine-protein phosphatase n=1 Tax=Coprobacter tertius TaxID=2944915 RepID=A0ABT1MH92_9BACT|nr:tyrosine-protein phosphatase [Coprobacter tertius]MCP9610611.1 tyrosine-protein phosphatase [Coprobacter tertius]
MHNYIVFLLFLTFVSCRSTPPEIEVVCESDENFEYILKWDVYPQTEGNVKIYTSVNPDKFDIQSPPLAECPISDGSVRVTAGKNMMRHYFLLCFDHKYDKIVGIRAPKLNYIQNFRDLGGYETQQKKYIRWGKIFRSGSLDSLDYLSSRRLNLMGIRTLIDFRTTDKFRTPPGSIQLENVINLPVNTPCSYVIRDKVHNNELRRGDAIIYMQDFYMEISQHSKSAFRSMFNQLLVEDNYPVVLSSRYGKDQVGFAVALILCALDVPKQQIIDDYLLSNDLVDKRVCDIDPTNLSYDVQEAITIFMSADQRFLSYTLEKLRKEYGSINKYLEQELGLTPEKRHKLQHILLYN